MKIVTAFCLMCITGSLGYSQTSINFNNRVPASGIDAPVSYAAGTVFGGPSGTRVDGVLHPTAQAALYAGPDGSSVDQLVLVGPAVSFLGGASAGYVNVGSSSARVVQGVVPGGFAMVQVRAWDAANGTTALSYEAAQGIPGALFGASTLLRIQILPGAALDLVGLQSFSIGHVPEPATVALLALATGCACFFGTKRG
jgi:hypothetical protein